LAARIPLDRIRNIGISAHIDSGKTTLTERILFYTGRIHKIHEVRGKDGVGAKMDSMDLEREKGITIQSAATYCVWNGSQEQFQPHNINIIDTPGHVDFTIEVERALRVLDGAILVLDSGKGVQSQSITVDKQMKRYRVPRIAFVNKMDNPGANYERVAAMLKEKLGHHPVRSRSRWARSRRSKGIIDPIIGKAYFFDGDDGETVREEEVPAEYAKATAAAREKIIHDVADVDDTLAEKFINEEPISVEELRAAIRRATLALKMTPVMCGSAIKNKGVQLLLDGVVHYLPNPKEVVNEAHDQSKGEEKVVVESDPTQAVRRPGVQAAAGQIRAAHVLPRLPGDGLGRRHHLQHEQRDAEGARPRMFRMHSEDREEVPSAEAGDIVAFYGVEASSGETFTDGKVNWTLTSMHVPAAVISLAVAPKDRTRRSTSRRRSTASRRKTRRSACTRTRSRSRPSSAAWASSTSTSTWSACGASTTATSSRASRRSPTARPSRGGRRSTTRTRSRPAAPASTPRSWATSSRSRRTRSRPTSSSTT
jgi:elongation factor G